MDGLLTKLPDWAIILFSSTLILTIIGFLLGILKILNMIFNKNVEFGSSIFKFSSKKEVEKIKDSSENGWISPHKLCPHKRDILIILTEHSELVQQRSNINLTLRLKQQMNYADGAIQVLRSKLQSIYADKLNEIGIKDVSSSISYKSYHLVLEDMADIFITIIRQAFLNNGFDQLNQKDFIEYTENRYNYFKSEFIDMLNSLYFYEQDINLGFLCIINGEHEDKLKAMFIKIFDKARDIAIDFNVKLLAIDEKINVLINKYI